MPKPEAGGPLLVGCPQLLIQYIRSYPPHLVVVSSIRNLRTRRDTFSLNREKYFGRGVCKCELDCRD
jgi:hypothetical protein